MNPTCSSADAAAERERRISEATQEFVQQQGPHATSEESLLASHADLLPELAERVRVLRLINLAQERARAARDGPQLPQFEGYQTVREIHRGGQGVVYQALEHGSNKVVAIKALRGAATAGERDLIRFEQEVQILDALSHPGIVGVRDTGHVADAFFYVMEYIDGEPVDQYAISHDLSVRDLLGLLSRIGQAVNSAHLRGVIHRDLKPGNILVDDEGQPHILDFGLAKLRDAPLTGGPVNAGIGESAEPDALTLTGQFLGSLPWASPEQAAGDQRRIDVRSDVYALGVIAYHLLTGAFPYPIAGGLHNALHSIMHAEAAPLRALKPEIDPDVERIVLKCLAKQPERRYQSAGELVRDVERCLAGEPVEARREGPRPHWYLLRKAVARHRVAASVAILAAAVIIGSSVTAWVMYGRQSQLLGEVARNADKAQQVQGFLQDMLAKFDPEFARGHDKRLLLDMLDDASARLDEEAAAGQPQVLATLHDTIGRAYLRLEVADRALPHLQRSLAIRRGAADTNPLDLADSITHLGDLHMHRSEYPAAEPLYREALAIREEHLPPGDPRLAGAFNDVGRALSSNRDFDGGEAMHQRALVAYRAAVGPEHPDVARTLSLIGMLRYNRDDYRSAAEPLAQALAMRERLHGRRHVDTAESMISLAKLQVMLGQYDSAEGLLREALSIEREAVGDEHSNVAWALHRLGEVLAARGQLAEAEAHLRDALELRLRIMEPDDPYIASALNSLGDVQMDRGELGSAEQSFRAAIDLWQRRLQPDDPYLRWCGNRLGELRQLQGRFDEAETLLREALAVREQCGTQEHVQLARTVASLATLLIATDRSPEAITLLTAALAEQRRLLGDEHPTIARLQGLLDEARRAGTAPRLGNAERDGNLIRFAMHSGIVSRGHNPMRRLAHHRLSRSVRGGV